MRCWVIGDDAVWESEWCNVVGAVDKRSVGRIALTKEEAEKALARLKAKVILERDTKGFKPKKNSGTFWAVGYDIHAEELLMIDKDSVYPGSCMFSDIVFETREDARRSALDHPKEWETYLGVEE